MDVAGRCLLCLEVNTEFVDAIFMDSVKNNTLIIKNLIEKHFWAMQHISLSSWLCANCWTEICDFHSFYMRIEKAHQDFGLLTKKKDEIDSHKIDFSQAPMSELFKCPVDEINVNGLLENEHNGNEIDSHIIKIKEDTSCPRENIDKDVLSIEENSNEECHREETSDISENESKYHSVESNLSNENLQNDLMNEKQKIFLEKQINEECFSNGNTLIHKRKRGRPRKLVRSTDNTIKIKKNKLRMLESKKSINFKENKAKTKNSNIEQETKLINMSIENNTDSNNDTDHEGLDSNEIKSSNKTCPPRIDPNEKDTFLKENFKITCFLCNIPFETFFSMRKHFDEHHKERGHVKCCNKKFYRRSILVDHVHFHLNPNYFKCNKCGKVMSDRRCLELHAEMHESNQEKNHCCDICGKAFAKLAVLRKHRMIHLSEEEKRFACSDCGKNFASNYLLSSHYRSVHLKKYAKICDICGKSIRCKDVFERHMLQHEGKPPPTINCDICGLVLTDKKALKRHKDVIHPVGGQHEYTCSICSKTSPNLRAHKRHVQYKHEMGYDHKCSICDKAFKRAPTLKEHMASHTGIILYTCPWCPKTFNSNANMHNHRKRVHPKEWEEASRKRYSGNLPPNFKPPAVNEHINLNEALDV